jgi:carbon-monoxide dehydrogenase small subunit
MRITLTVNGEDLSADLRGAESLLTVLRDQLALPGSKNACEHGECGSCSVVLDGDLVCACLVMAADAAGSTVRTVEGYAQGAELHPVQQAMLDAGAVQCGFCTPGFVVAAAELFDANPVPTADELREELAGNVCRCTGYGAILRGLEALAAANAAGGPSA